MKASIGANQDRVVLASKSTKKSFSIDDGGTGFFAAIDVNEGTYKARRRGGVSTRRARELSEAVERVSRAVSDLFNDERGATVPPAVDKVRAAVRVKILDHSVNGKLSERLKTDFGIEIDFRKSNPLVFEFTPAHQRGFEKSLRSDPIEIRKFLVGQISSRGDGFVGELLKVLELAQRDLRNALNASGSQQSSGTLLNAFA